MKKCDFFEVFQTASKMEDFIYALCFGFYATDFHERWEEVKRELDYWKAIEYDKTDGSKFCLGLYRGGILGRDTGVVGDVPGTIYCQIVTRHAERFDTEPFTEYRVLVKRMKEEQA